MSPQSAQKEGIDPRLQIQEGHNCCIMYGSFESKCFTKLPHSHSHADDKASDFDIVFGVAGVQIGDF